MSQPDVIRTADEHASDCAVHNAPALPVGPCDCGAVAASLRRKLQADDSSSITLEELLHYWSDQPYSAIAQATVDHLERLQHREGLRNG